MRGVRQAPSLPLAGCELDLSPRGSADISRRIHVQIAWDSEQAGRHVGAPEHAGVDSSHTAWVLFRLDGNRLGLVSPRISIYTVTALHHLGFFLGDLPCIF